MEYDDIQKRWDYFYNLPQNSLDIIILGNSHAYSTYSPNIIDAICKTNSFVLASNSQKLEQTYFNLKETLKYQKPKIVVIPVTILSGDSWRGEAGDYRVYSNLDGMRMSKNKVKAIIAQRPIADYINSLLPLYRYHENWKKTDLISENLGRMEKGLLEDYRGFSPSYSEMGADIAKKFEEAPKTDLTNYGVNISDLTYLKKISDLSKTTGFKVIYVKSPNYSDLINPTYSVESETINKIISSFGHEYLDFNLLEKQLELNFRSFENGFISYQHTSYFGAIQVSQALADYLNLNYLNLYAETEPRHSWKTRMSSKKEYLFYGKENEINVNAVYSSKVDFLLLDSVIVNSAHIFKLAENSYELVLEFNENIDKNKLIGYKFYLHLYPHKSDNNIKKESSMHGFENFDFEPILLPISKSKFYCAIEINTKINDVEKVNLGLFKSGSPERSNEFTIDNIRFD